MTPTQAGVDIVAYVASIQPPDSFRFFRGGQLSGNWGDLIYGVPDLIRVSQQGWNELTLHVDYSAVDAYLKGVNPALGVTPDMASAVGIRFTSGHDTGIPGWSQNSGTERDALVTLPAKAG